MTIDQLHLDLFTPDQEGAADQHAPAEAAIPRIPSIAERTAFDPTYDRSEAGKDQGYGPHGAEEVGPAAARLALQDAVAEKDSVYRDADPNLPGIQR